MLCLFKLRSFGIKCLSYSFCSLLLIISQCRTPHPYIQPTLNWPQSSLDPHWAMRPSFSGGCFSIQHWQVFVSLWGCNLFMTAVTMIPCVCVCLCVCFCVVVMLEGKLWCNILDFFQESLQGSDSLCIACPCTRVNMFSFIRAISVFTCKPNHW